jgi:heme-degrading monooxygenase HmoA
MSMIARVWRGWAVGDGNVDAYQRHFTTKVAPHLQHIAGFRGAHLHRRETEGRTEFMAVSLWDSMEAVRGFAGDDPEVAIVEPAARALLCDFEEVVTHYETVFERAPS